MGYWGTASRATSREASYGVLNSLRKSKPPSLVTNVALLEGVDMGREVIWEIRGNRREDGSGTVSRLYIRALTHWDWCWGAFGAGAG